MKTFSGHCSRSGQYEATVFVSRMHETCAYDASIFNFNDLLAKWLEEMFLPIYIICEKLIYLDTKISLEC